MIKVILREDVAGFGKAGEAKQVKDGFARNFLFPKKLALAASDETLKQIELDQNKKKAKKELEIKKAQEAALRLAGLSVTITAEVNEEEKLYGSLNASDIAAAIVAEGVEVNKKAIVLETPIKELGIYDIEVRLHPEVTSKIKVWVVKK
ncbi:MAG: 50S ribosomal protein L9 [Candidatus Omnitrophota bacterium]